MKNVSAWQLRLLVLSLVVCLSGQHLQSFAQQRPTRPAMAGGSPLEQALNPVGTLRPSACRSFDAAGYRMRTDPATGQPASAPTGVGDERWHDLFGSLTPSSIAGPLVVASNGDIIAQGVSLFVNGNPVTYPFARWNGTGWQAFGTTLNAPVYAMAQAANGDVIVAGAFTDAGGNPAADHIARWNGTAWAELGGGLDDNVYSLAILPSGTVVAVGQFYQAGGDPYATYIARWNGATWQGFGPGVHYGLTQASCLAVAPNGDLVVGTSFWESYRAADNIPATGAKRQLVAQSAGALLGGVGVARPGRAADSGQPTGNKFFANGYVARWDGTGWEQLGDDLLGGVTQLAVRANGEVVAKGDFYDAEGNFLGIVHWNGTGWQSLSSSLNGEVWGMTVAPNDDLLLGGDFTNAGGNPAADHLVRWDGTTWHSLGTGLNAGATPLGVTSAGSVVVAGAFTATGDGSVSLNHFGIYHAAPAITSFTPASGTVGTTVTITGSNLIGTTAVAFNGTAATFTVNSATQLTATVPAGAATGVISVTAPGGPAASATSFSVVASPPVITYVAPMSGGPVGTVLTITGTGFTGATSVKIGAVQMPYTVVSATRIMATIPAGAVTGKITVITPAGSRTTSGSIVVTGTAPTLTSLSPATGPVGTSVTFTGTAFTGATSVKFNGLAATFTVVSATQIAATVPAGATTGPVSVTTPGGMTSGLVYTVPGTVSPPTIGSVMPLRGPVGTVLAINGANLTGATSVKIGSAAMAFTVVSSAKITATIPAGAVTGRITVVTPGGAKTTTGAITVTSARPGPGTEPSETATTASQLTLAPNPAQTAVTVQLEQPAGGGTLVQIYDRLGQVRRTAAVLTEETGVTLSVAGLPPGLYTVRCGALSRRLVVE